MAKNPNTAAQQKVFNQISMPKSPKEPRKGESNLSVPTPNHYAQPEPYGSYNKEGASYPKDVIQLDIYNDQDFYYETISEASSFRIGQSELTIDLEKELTAAGYEAGDFRVAIRPLRNYLGSAVGTKLIVQEISSDRLEVRLIPAQLAGGEDFESQKKASEANIEFSTFFSEGFFKLDKQAVLASLYMFTDSITSIEINDYIQDKFTVPGYPFSIIFKLNQQVPLSVSVGGRVWIAQEINPPTVEDVLVVAKDIGRQLRKIKGPNFDIRRKNSAATDTDYLSWDEILSIPDARPVTRTIFSQSLVEGVELNVDYGNFENFIKFSSAYDRIKNFEYKVKLIEGYQSTSSSLADSTASESFYVQTQLTSTLNKIDNIVGAFDGFEKYMYFQSSSYVTNSFGEFLDIAWPKSGSKPYQLYSYTSSQVETWLDGVLSSASLYDNRNSYSLRKLVPNHIQEGQEDLVDSFVNMLGHFFDIQYEYINQLPKIHDRQQKLTEGFAKELVYHIGASLGIDFSNGDNFEDLWSYTLGVNTSGSYDNTNTLQISGEDRTREVWKRIINNLPLLLRTKGTERGIRALINCFGIPSTIIRIKEFGGPEADLDKASQYKYDRFNYGTAVVTGTPYQYLEAPFKALKQNGKIPETIELTVKFAPTSSTTPNELSILKQANFTVSAYSGSHVKFTLGASSVNFSSSIYDLTPHNIAIVDDGTRVTCYVIKNSYGKAVATSGSIVGSLSAGTIYLPNTAGASGMSGSVQELRYWTDPLPLRVLKAHATAPTSFFVDDLTTETGGTGSYDGLAVRWTLGSDNTKPLTASGAYPVTVTSKHPNQSITVFDDSTNTTLTIQGTLTAGFTDSWVQTHYLEWPDIAGNRQVSNKIRFEDTFNVSNELLPNTSVIRSLQDNQPVDSPRLGVYLSPTDEVNQDIAEQFGGLTMDDFIGSYNDIYNENYADLKQLKNYYLKKVSGRYRSQNYIRLLKYFNASVFSIAKQLAPQRANLQTGLVIEPDLLTRSKVKLADRPEFEDEYYETTLDLPSVVEPTADTEVIEPGDIDLPTQIVIGDNLIVAEGSAGAGQTVGITVKANEYNNRQIPSQGTRLATTYSGSTPGSLISKKEALEDDIYTFVTSTGYDKIKGTKYDYYTWTGPVADPTVYVNSGLVSNSADYIYVPSLGDDYSNPIGTQVYNSRGSSIVSPGDIVYKQEGDILQGQVYTGLAGTNRIVYTGSYGQYPIANLGVRFFTTTANTYWTYREDGPGLFLNITALITGQGYMLVPLPYAEDPDCIYQVQFRQNPTLGGTYTIQFGSGSAEYQYSISPSAGQLVRVQSKAANGLLYIATTTNLGTSGFMYNLKVSMLNFPGQFQDYHIGPYASLGLRNQKYNGCKMTSPDFNEDSPDTIDGGPVVVITEGPSTNLNVKPTIDGTYEFK